MSYLYLYNVYFMYHVYMYIYLSSMSSRITCSVSHYAPGGLCASLGVSHLTTLVAVLDCNQGNYMISIHALKTESYY